MILDLCFKTAGGRVRQKLVVYDSKRSKLTRNCQTASIGENPNYKPGG